MRDAVPLGAAANENADESDVMAAARRLQRWRSATNKARAAVRLGRSGPDVAAEAEAKPDPLVEEISAKYCYPIAEQAAAAAAVESGGSREQPEAADARRAKKRCKWRCPLSCRPEELPQGAKLHGCVLDMGEAPDMKSCKGTWGRGGAVRKPMPGGRQAHSGMPEARTDGAEAVAPSHPAAAGVEVSVPGGPQCGPGAVSGDGERLGGVAAGGDGRWREREGPGVAGGDVVLIALDSSSQSSADRGVSERTGDEMHDYDTAAAGESEDSA